MVDAQAQGAGKDTCSGRYLSCVLRARLCGACQAFLWDARNKRGSLPMPAVSEYCERMQQVVVCLECETTRGLVWCLARCPCPQPTMHSSVELQSLLLPGWLGGCVATLPCRHPAQSAVRRHGCPLLLGLHAHSSLPGFLATAAAGDSLGLGGGGQFRRGWLVVWWRCLFVCGGPGLL